MITIEKGKSILNNIYQLMFENKDYLISLDSKMGDGDLGLTMISAFSAANEQMKNFEDESIGKFFIKSGMIMAKAAPSTMGTLMATGFMRGGKEVIEEKRLDSKGLFNFFDSFTKGLMDRGKAKPGEKTVIDVFYPVSLAIGENLNLSIGELLNIAVDSAQQALEKTKDMKAQHGRAAYYQEKSIGVQDPGATAGLLIIKGFQKGYSSV